MSIVSFFTKPTAPKFGVAGNLLQFDGIISDNLEFDSFISSYPVESGINIAESKVILPTQWSVIGAVSNNPLGISATDFTGVLSSLIPDNSVISELTGLSAGFLAGSDATRSSAALSALIALRNQETNLTVFCGDITLHNMTITKITRLKNKENENCLIFQADLIEFIDVGDIIDKQSTKSRDDDNAAIQAANKKFNGDTTGFFSNPFQDGFINSGVGRLL
jgi:hypothetical protein